MLPGILAVCFSVGCGADSPPPRADATWRRVASWTGSGNAQLETFLIEGGRLRLRWETKNETTAGTGRFKVRLHSADSGRVVAEPIDARGEGHDAAEIADEHPRFYLSVESNGVSWSIVVEEHSVRR